MRFFEGTFAFWKLRVPKRLLITITIVIIIKVVTAIFIYAHMNIQSEGTAWSDPNRIFDWEQNQVFLQNADSKIKWPYLFTGWDSAWYLSIMTKGYIFSSQSYAFLPGLPIFGVLLNSLVHNSVASIAICGLIFGVLWVPFFQFAIEEYTDERTAMWATLLFAFSPYVFVFTTVAYTEGLFLSFSLITWYSFKQGKIGWASGLASVSALTRITGILIILPMLISSLKQKRRHRRQNIVLSLLPLMSLVIWFIYFQILVGDILAPIHTTEWSSMYTIPSLLFQGVPENGLHVFDMSTQYWPTMYFWLLPVAIISALFTPPFLIYELAKKDKPMACYALTGYVGILLFGAVVSMPRFISALFPLWLALAVKRKVSRKTEILLVTILAASLIISVDMWMSFLDGQFIA